MSEGRRGPLVVLALVLAAGVALLALEHHRVHAPPALTAPAERLAAPGPVGSAFPASAPARAR